MDWENRFGPYRSRIRNPQSKIQKMDYTCNEYRTEMILLGLQRRLLEDDLSEAEKKKIKEQIREIEQAMGMA